MLICKLIDSIWATRKYEELDGMKLMRVEVLDGPDSGRRPQRRSTRRLSLHPSITRHLLPTSPSITRSTRPL